MLVFFLGLIFPLFPQHTGIYSRPVPAFILQLNFFARAAGEATTDVLKFSNLSIMQVLFKTAHFRGIPYTMLVNEHKNHLAFLKI